MTQSADTINTPTAGHAPVLKKLANVPVSEFKDVFGKGFTQRKVSPMRRLLGMGRDSDLSSLKTFRVHFNAALWLRFYRLPANPVGFWLEYEDATGVKTLLVDQVKVQDAGQVMLAGQVCIPVVGGLAGVRACCSGIRPDEHFRVEELFVQRQQPLPAPARTNSFGARAPKLR